MVLKNSSQILQSLFTTVQHHTIFIPMAVVYPHSAVTVIQLAVKSCAVHQFNSFGNIHTLPLLWYSQGIYPNLPKFSLRRQQGLLQRAVKGKFCELHQGIAGEAVQVSSTCLTGRERLRGDLANRDLSIFIWDLGQCRPCLTYQMSLQRRHKKMSVFGGDVLCLRK